MHGMWPVPHTLAHCSHDGFFWPVVTCHGIPACTGPAGPRPPYFTAVRKETTYPVCKLKANRNISNTCDFNCRRTGSSQYLEMLV